MEGGGQWTGKVENKGYGRRRAMNGEGREQGIWKAEGKEQGRKRAKVLNTASQWTRCHKVTRLSHIVDRTNPSEHPLVSCKLNIVDAGLTSIEVTQKGTWRSENWPKDLHSTCAVDGELRCPGVHSSVPVTPSHVKNQKSGTRYWPEFREVRTRLKVPG